MARPKKLKRIPSDIASYVTISGQAAKDEHDKMLAVSYGHSKIDMIDWHIALLDSGSKKYVVPQTRAQLVSMREEIQAAIKTVIDKPLNQGKKSAIISVDYPEGYDG
jgi:hypothetical protein